MAFSGSGFEVIKGVVFRIKVEKKTGGLREVRKVSAYINSTHIVDYIKAEWLKKLLLVSPYFMISFSADPSRSLH
jgi:hypothetical protein